MALPLGLKPGLKAKTIVEREQDGRVLKEEYAATCLAHSVVYRLNGKSVKTAEVPEEVKEQLNATMMVGAGAPETQPKLEVVDEASDITPEMIDNLPDPIQEGEIVQAAKAIEQADEFGFSEADAPEIDLSAELEAAEARSVDNVNLRELVKALYERFGVYTVYMNKTPSRSDINPLTGAMMNTLTLGQANQGFRVAQRTGTSWNPQAIKAQIDAARNARTTTTTLPQSSMQANQVVGDAYGQEVNMPSLHGEPLYNPQDRTYNRKYESPHQSAVRPVRGKESDGTDPDEVYAEPPINARNPIVRPFVSNKKSEEQLSRISQNRVVPGSNVSFDELV